MPNWKSAFVSFCKRTAFFFYNFSCADYFSVVLSDDMRRQLEEIMKKTIMGYHPDGLNLIRELGPNFVRDLARVKVITEPQRNAILQKISTGLTSGLVMPRPVHPIITHSNVPVHIPHPAMPVPQPVPALPASVDHVISHITTQSELQK